MKWIDIPPVWLLGFAILTLLSKPVISMTAFPLVGGAVVLVGLALMVAAVLRMWQAKTTPIPHMQPSALVADGIFAFTRNPIYLGDAIVLGGLAIRWGAPVGLLLIPAFVWVITQRFIKAEEARLEAGFGAAFDDYRKKTRRWF